MLDISLKRKMVHTTTLEATITGSMIEEEETIKGMIVMEEMKREEEIIQVIMKKIVILRRSQDNPGMEVMLLIILNISLFPLLHIHGIFGWLIVGSLIISLSIRNFSLIW